MSGNVSSVRRPRWLAVDRKQKPGRRGDIEREHPRAGPHREPRTEHDRPAGEGDRRRAVQPSRDDDAAGERGDEQRPAHTDDPRAQREVGQPARHQQGHHDGPRAEPVGQPRDREARRGRSGRLGRAVTGRGSGAGARAASGATVVRPGRRTTMRHPWVPSGPASAWMVPWCRSTIHRTMARPRPAPPSSRVRAWSRRWNRSNTRCRSSAGMPGPRSVTTSSTPSSPRLVASTSTGAGG